MIFFEELVDIYFQTCRCYKVAKENSDSKKMFISWLWKNIHSQPIKKVVKKKSTSNFTLADATKKNSDFQTFLLANCVESYKSQQ